MPTWKNGPLTVEFDPPDKRGGIGKVTVDHDSGGVLWAKFGAPSDMASQWPDDRALAACLSKGKRPVAFVVDAQAASGMMGKSALSEMLVGAMGVLADAGVAKMFLVPSPEMGESARAVVEFYGRHGFRVARGCSGPEDEVPVMRADL